MPFIDRVTELQFLETKWLSGKAELLVLWGKRRVGKTELVKQFIQGKPSIYFMAESTGEKEQLHRFSKAIRHFFHEPLLETRGFSQWEEVFIYLQSKKERLVLAIDEFPYLIQSNPAIPSLFQKGWDEYLADSNICLILFGSSMAMMENEVLGYRSPLYGRRSGQWLVEPMPFKAAGLFREGKPFSDRLAHFAVAGGIPAYWLQLSPEKDIVANLQDHVLRKGEMLYDEVEFLLRMKLREPRYYFALLQAIAQGKRKLSEIVNATGLTQSLANKYLGVLADLRIVEHEVPVTEATPLKSKKGLYRIHDEFCRFWFRFVLPYRSELEMGRVDQVAQTIISRLPQYLVDIYEKVAWETLPAHMDSFFPFTAIGRYWDRGEKIDVVAVNPEMNAILFCEVKASEKPVGVDILEALREKVAKVRWGRAQRREYFCLFSKAGFTKALLEQADREGVVLFQEDWPVQNMG